MSLDAGRVGVRADQVDIHGRVTSPSFLNELLDDLPEWTDMPVRVNGTEEVLPSNTSVPVTSPILADIAYPDIRRDNQYFTYRESPTPVDGLAKIKSIKGNTLVWNQLVQNGNFADGTNHWGFVRGTISVTNNVLTYEVTEVGTSNSANRFSQVMNGIIAGHKYLLFAELMSSKDGIRVVPSKGTTSQYFADAITLATANTWYKVSGISEILTDGDALTFRYVNVATVGAVGDKIYAKNIMLFDLTKMGLDITDPSEFTSLFPSYYSYNSGSLLSFNGTGIKTTGKNLLPLPIAETKNGITLTHNDDGSITLKGTATAHTYFDFFTDFNSTLYAGYLFIFQTSQTPISDVTCRTSKSDRIAIQNFRVNVETAVRNEGDGLYLALRVANGTVMPTDGYTLYPMLRMPSQDSTFEPYTSSTLSLPISTYFPTGMKSAGNVYDELKPSKAITRLKATSFTSVSAFDSSGKLGVLGEVADAVDITTGASTMPNDKAVFETYSLSGLRNNDVNGITQYGKYFYVRLQGKTTLEEYNTYLSANPLVIIYELATPVELPTLSLGD